MELYRFFLPHHNPRLFSTALRQHELYELEQAASELLKALVRAQKRAGRKPKPPLFSEHFNDIIKALRFVVESLQTLCDAHTGDGHKELVELIKERAKLVGWEGWSALLNEQLAAVPVNGDSEQEPEARESY